MTERTEAENRARVQMGAGAAVGGFTLWGLSPLFWKLFAAFGAVEVLTHRILWSLLFLGAIVQRGEGFAHVWEKIKAPHVFRMLALSALLILINWLLFIWATTHGRVLDASLGYFMNPLVNVAIGGLLLGERLNRIQTVAVVLAGIGVINLSLDLTTLPWIPVTLAVSFAFYGYIRKTVNIESVEGLFVETLIIAPFALGYFIWLVVQGESHFLSAGWLITFLFVFCGPFTSIPLMMYNYAARRVRLTTIGIAQYIAPSMHFIIAVSYGETITLRHIITFALIWTALILYTGNAIREEQLTRRRLGMPL